MTTHAKHHSTASTEPAVTYWAPRPVIEQPAWKGLEAHYEKIRELHLRRLFADDPGRGERRGIGGRLVPSDGVSSGTRSGRSW